MIRVIPFSLIAVLVCAAPSPAAARGQQSGTLSGRLSTADRLPLPGVTVTVASESLPGTRETVSDVNGVYSIPGLPAGRYRILFRMEGLGTVERAADAIERGVRRRAGRVWAPGFVGVALALRGLMQPLTEARTTRSPELREALRLADPAHGALEGQDPILGVAASAKSDDPG